MITNESKLVILNTVSYCLSSRQRVTQQLLVYLVTHWTLLGVRRRNKEALFSLIFVWHEANTAHKRY